VKPLNEPAVHWGEQVIGFLAFALLLPEPGQAGSGTEFEGLGLLVASDIQGVKEATLGFSLIVRRLLQPEFAFQSMYFCFVPAFSSLVHDRLCFREHCESCLWLSHGAIGFGEQREKIRSLCLCSVGTPGCQTLVHLLDACLRLSLMRERPAAQYSTKRDP